MLSLVLAAALSGIPVAPWAYWGMTRDEVVAAGDKGGTTVHKDGDGLRTLFQLEQKVHEVDLRFDRDRLSGATLRIPNDPVCITIPTMLMERYGKPIKAESTPHHYLYLWRSEQSGLVVSAYMDQPDASKFPCEVGYEPIPHERPSL